MESLALSSGIFLASSLASIALLTRGGKKMTTMATRPTVHAYYNPSSICSHKVLFALHECNVPFVAHEVSLGKLEQYAPEYVVVNPKMVVPSLVLVDDESKGEEKKDEETLKTSVGEAVKSGTILPRGKDDSSQVLVYNDSADIIQFIAESLDKEQSLLLTDTSLQQTHDELDQLMRDFPTVALSFGILTHPHLMYSHDLPLLEEKKSTPEYQKLVSDVPRHGTYIGNKIPHLEQLAKEYPQLKKFYTDKIEYVQKSYVEVDEARALEAIEQAQAALDVLERQLSKSSVDGPSFLLGQSHATLIDLPWTVILHRVYRLGLTKRVLEPHPRVLKYYKEMSERPAFQKALEASGF